ncbi:MAG TPA: hypothetical protein VFO19_16715 [Vicinamibacterales bacterium]|nr:hypothetical protein [Vicinamibacterales bacterium]
MKKDEGFFTDRVNSKLETQNLRLGSGFSAQALHRSGHMPSDVADRAFAFACVPLRHLASGRKREAQYWLRVITATKLAPEAMLRPRLAAVAVLVAILTKAVKELRKPPKEGQEYPEGFGPPGNAG